MTHTDDIFTLSIAYSDGSPTRQHGFHLGTDEKMARDLAVREWQRQKRNGTDVATVALHRHGKMYAVFDGAFWSDEDQDARFMRATVLSTSSSWAVVFAVIDVRGRTDHRFPELTVPCVSMGHADAVAKAYNAGGRL